MNLNLNIICCWSAILLIIILSTVSGNPTNQDLLRITIDYNSNGSNCIDNCCMFNDDSKQQLINLQKLLSDKAKLECLMDFKQNLLHKLDSEGQIPVTNILVQITLTTDEHVECSLNCSESVELLQCISESLQEDFMYLLHTNEQTAFPNITESTSIPNCDESGCGVENLQSILAKQVYFASAEERADKVQALFHISEHLHREILHNNELPDKHTFIGYWKPRDAKSARMLDLLTEVKELETDTRVYLLNCDYFKSACKSVGVTRVPELRSYVAGKLSTTYGQSYTTDGIIDWIRKVNAPVLYKLTQDSDVHMFRDGIIPNSPFTNETQDAVTVGFFNDTKSVIYKEFIGVANKLHGKYHFGVFTNRDITKWATHPIIFTFKPKETGSKVQIWHQGVQNQTIEQFVIQSSVPTVMTFNEESLEEISTSTHQVYLLIEKADSMDKGISALKKHFYELADNISNARSLPVKFAYAALQMNDANAIMLLKTLRIRQKLLPALILIDLSKCTYYVQYPLQSNQAQPDHKSIVSRLIDRPDKPYACLLSKSQQSSTEVTDNKAKTEL